MSVRTIELNEILDLVNCAEDYGHWNNVCMSSLYTFAKPVHYEDIMNYVSTLDEDEKTNAYNNLKNWIIKYSETIFIEDCVFVNNDEGLKI